jgi:hypothetical protein
VDIVQEDKKTMTTANLVENEKRIQNHGKPMHGKQGEIQDCKCRRISQTSIKISVSERQKSLQACVSFYTGNKQ